MSSGGKGTSNVTGCLCPREMAVISKPRKGYEDVLNMRKMLYACALNALVDVGKPRKPLMELSESNQKTMKQTMKRLEILNEDSYQREYFGKK